MHALERREDHVPELKATPIGSGPLLTMQVHDALLGAAREGTGSIECSLDLGRSTTAVVVDQTGWATEERRYPFLEACRERTVYRWTGAGFEPVQR